MVVGALRTITTNFFTLDIFAHDSKDFWPHVKDFRLHLKIFHVHREIIFPPPLHVTQLNTATTMDNDNDPKALVCMPCMDTDPKEPMQQSNVYMGNYRLLFNKAHEARMKQAYVITDLDRINILESGKKNAPTRHAEKKQYLTTLFEARDEILRIAETLDATFVINLRNHL
jgi:hypothetical protein